MRIPKDNNKIIYINNHNSKLTCNILLFFDNLSLESVQRETQKIFYDIMLSGRQINTSLKSNWSL